MEQIINILTELYKRQLKFNYLKLSNNNQLELKLKIRNRWVYDLEKTITLDLNKPIDYQAVAEIYHDTDHKNLEYNCVKQIRIKQLKMMHEWFKEANLKLPFYIREDDPFVTWTLSIGDYMITLWSPETQKKLCEFPWPKVPYLKTETLQFRKEKMLEFVQELNAKAQSKIKPLF